MDVCIRHLNLKHQRLIKFPRLGKTIKEHVECENGGFVGHAWQLQ